MKKIIAVTSPYSNIHILFQLDEWTKQNLLLFDEIKIKGIKDILATGHFNDLAYLYEQQIIKDFTEPICKVKPSPEVSNVLYELYGNRLSLELDATLSDDDIDVREQAIVSGVNDQYNNYIYIEHKLSDLALPYPLKASKKEKDAYRILVDNFPIPVEKIHLSQLLEYRNDPDSRRRFAALRLWISEMASTTQDFTFINDKLEHLLMEYEHHLKLHRMKYQLGSLQSSVVGICEVIENTVKGNLSHAAKILFGVSQNKIDLLIGESKLPGSEVSYIIKTKEKFT